MSLNYDFSPILTEIFHFSPKFRWPAIRKTGAKCRWEKFRQISVKIGEKLLQAKNRRNLQKIAGRCNLSEKFRFVSPIFVYRFFGKFPDISYQSSPRTGYKICLFFLKKKKKHKMLFGNLIMICRQRLCFSAWLKIVDLGFVKFKSNGTKAKRP